MDHDDPDFLRRAAEAKARVRQLPPIELATATDSGAQLLDVRSAEEHAAGSLPGALNLPIEALAADIAARVPDRRAPIVCFCNGGNRGSLAAAALLELGYTNVMSIEGGLRGWRAARAASGKPNPAPVLRQDDDPAAAGRGVVDAGLGADNAAAMPLHEVRPLAIYAHADEAPGPGEVVAGAVGRTWGDCAELQQLWVAPAQRRQGLAARLLAAFEAAAAARGVRLVYLETFSAQAPGFYAKQGYVEQARIGGFAPGLSRHSMLKALGPPGSAHPPSGSSPATSDGARP
jgi:rhodanese-related sulfurtransferase/GNAT superfamily N-acetyltransferase